MWFRVMIKGDLVYTGLQLRILQWRERNIQYLGKLKNREGARTLRQLPTLEELKAKLIKLVTRHLTG